MSRSLVLGIGLSKTGTTSLNEALEILGYRSVHNPAAWLLEAADGSLALDLGMVASVEGVTDLPVARFYRDVDAQLERVKFVVTTRDVDSWLESAENHFYGYAMPPLERRLVAEVYGSSSFDRALYRDAYLRHYRQVKEYFISDPTRLLTLDIREPDKWERLCDFLGEEIPDATYPSSNSASRGPQWAKAAVRANPTLLRTARRVRAAWQDRLL